MEVAVYLSEVNCLQGKHSQPAMPSTPQWNGVTLDAGVFPHLLHEMKIGFDPPGVGNTDEKSPYEQNRCNKPEVK